MVFYNVSSYYWAFKNEYFDITLFNFCIQIFPNANIDLVKICIKYKSHIMRVLFDIVNLP